MLKSTSGTEPSLLPHTHDAAPVKSKVALQLTASQGMLITTVWHILRIWVTTKKGITVARVTV